jgi:hypothetical protein
VRPELRWTVKVALNSVNRMTHWAFYWTHVIALTMHTTLLPPKGPGKERTIWVAEQFTTDHWKSQITRDVKL